MTTTITFKVGDKVKHRDERVSWQEGIIIATQKTDPWMCAPKMVIVERKGSAVSIPIALLEMVEEDF